MGDREGAGGTKTTPRQEEATTSETLDDLTSAQTCAASPTSSAASDQSNENSATENSTPSPDGAFDSGGEESDAGEPM